MKTNLAAECKRRAAASLVLSGEMPDCSPEAIQRFRAHSPNRWAAEVARAKAYLRTEKTKDIVQKTREAVKARAKLQAERTREVVRNLQAEKRAARSSEKATEVVRKSQAEKRAERLGEVVCKLLAEKTKDIVRKTNALDTIKHAVALVAAGVSINEAARRLGVDPRRFTSSRNCAEENGPMNWQSPRPSLTRSDFNIQRGRRRRRARKSAKPPRLQPRDSVSRRLPRGWG